MDIIDTNTLLPTTADYIFFSSSNEAFIKTDHVLGHKTSLNKFEKIESIHSLLSNNIEIKVEIDNRKILEKIWQLYNTLLITLESKKISQETLKIFWYK